MPILNFLVYTLMELFRKPENWWQICKQTSSTFYISKDAKTKTWWEEKIIRTSLLERY